MTSSPNEFGRLLTEAVRRIHSIENKSIQIVQDELGYMIGRERGGSSIEHWRKGHIPAKQTEIEQLARGIIEKTDFNRNWLDKFLRSADYAYRVELCNELFPEPQIMLSERMIPSTTTLRSLSTLRSNRENVQLAPFVAGPPISHARQFFGREDEMRRIFNMLNRLPLQNIVVIGPQRSGKTSLLRYLQKITTTPRHQLRPDQHNNWLSEPECYNWVYVDFQDPRRQTQEELLRYLLVELRLSIPKPCTLNNFMEVVTQELKDMTVILMDEVGSALAAPELDLKFWWSLRALGTTQMDGRLAFILTSQQSIKEQARAYEKPSPFFNIFQRMDLGPLTATAARALIESSPRPFDVAEVEWIMEQSRRWPALLQILCLTHLEALEMGVSQSAWREEGLRRIADYHYLLESPWPPT